MATRGDLRGRSADRINEYPMASGVTITDGDLVMLTSTKFARTAGALAGNRGCVGRAIETVVNSGGDGAANIKVEEGIFTIAGTGFSQANVDEAAYASGGNAISPTQGANQPYAGRVQRFRSATLVDIEVKARNVTDDVGALTPPPAGTANTTLVDMPAVGGSGATTAQEAAIDDNFADVATQINNIRAALRAAGIMD